MTTNPGVCSRNGVVAALLAACLSAASAQAGAQERATAVLSALTGAPEIHELSDARARAVGYVAVGREYTLPLEIRTAAEDSATFALTNSVIEVSPNTTMRIVAPEVLRAGIVQRVLQQTGSSLFSVRRGSVERFQVETPFLVSVVKGTVFNVLVHDDGATVSLYEGRLQVDSVDGGQTVELAPGDVAFAGRDGVLRLLEIELTRAGATARDSVAAAPGARSDLGENTLILDENREVAGLSDAVLRPEIAWADESVLDAIAAPPLETVVETPFETRFEDNLDPVIGEVGAPISDLTNDTVVPVVVDLVDPIAEGVVDPLVADVVEPLVADVVEPLVSGVIDPVVDSLIDPLIDDVVAPLVNDVVDPLIGSVVDPLVDGVVDPLLDDVVDPLLDEVVDPLVEVVDPVLGGVIDPLVGGVVDPLVDDVVDPLLGGVLDPLLGGDGALGDTEDEPSGGLLGGLLGGIL